MDFPVQKILNIRGCVKIGTSSYLFFYRHGMERFFLCRFFDVKSVTSTHEAAFCVIWSVYWYKNSL